MGNTESSTTEKKRPAQADVPRSGDHTGFPPPPPNGAEETRVLGSPAHISTSTSSTSEVPLSLNDRVRNHYVVDDEVRYSAIKICGNFVDRFHCDKYWNLSFSIYRFLAVDNMVKCEKHNT